MKPYVKRMGLQAKERPFNVGGGDEFRYRNNYRPGAKLRRDRINRTYKKSVRQQVKKELLNEISSIESQNKTPHNHDTGTTN